jgi:hypothetical protein
MQYFHSFSNFTTRKRIADILWTVLFLSVACPLLQSQPILFLRRQSQVDSIPILYPNLQEIGLLLIGYVEYDTTKTDIYDLSPLATVKKIHSDLYVRNNPRLKTLYGLHNIDTINSTFFIKIQENDSLRDLSGLASLRYAGTELQIQKNKSLQSLHGLENIEVLDKLFIGENPQLPTLEGLDNLEAVRMSFGLRGNGLLDVYLPKFKRVGSLSVSEEPNLKTLEGLAGLDSLGFSYSYHDLYIYKNPALTTLLGIENCRVHSGTTINISTNPALSDVSALWSMAGDTILKMEIYDNPALDSLVGIQNLKHITKGLKIYNNPSLDSISFPNLVAIDTATWQFDSSLVIRNNDELSYLSLPKLKKTAHDFWLQKNYLLKELGLGSLEIAGRNLVIRSNIKLESLSGLELLKKVGGHFSIGENDSLSSLCDFQDFNYIGGSLSIGVQSKIQTLEGLETLKYVGRSVGLGNDSLLYDISALENIDSIGWLPEMFISGGKGISIINCPSLSSLNAFENLEGFSPLSSLSVSNCDSLENIKLTKVDTLLRIIITDHERLASVELPTLTTVGRVNYDYKYIKVLNNPNLFTLDGFSGIQYLRDSFSIRNNPFLTDCDAICRLLDRGIPASRFKLSGNAFPCNTVQEIEEHICDTLSVISTPEEKAVARLLLFPNPARDYISINIENTRLPATIEMRDYAGRILWNKPVYSNGQQFYIGDLPAGIFFVHLTEYKAWGKLALTR